LDNDESSIQISSNTAETQNAHGSEKSSAIILNFLDIGLSNKAKSLNQLPNWNEHMVRDMKKSKPTIEQGPKKKMK
jgi:hypothetical protein